MLKRHYFAPGAIEHQPRRRWLASAPAHTLRGGLLLLARMAVLAATIGMAAGLFVGWAWP